MRTLRYLVLALLAIFVVVAIVGFFLPSKVHLERSIEINRDKQTIFKVINSYGNFNKWSPWYDLDVNAQYDVTGPKSGIGSAISWSGNEKVGNGSNEIIESVQDSHIKNIMYFGNSDAPAYSIISLKQIGKNTTVTWAFENDFGYNVFFRYFGLVIEDMIAPDYERGLKKLKTYAESLPMYDYSNISTVNTTSQMTYGFQATTTMQAQDITPVIASSYDKIVGFLTAHNISMTGTPKIVNLTYADNVFEFLALIPVSDNQLIDEAGEIKAYSTYVGKALKFIHKGSYKNFKKSYEILNTYMQQNNLDYADNSWEDYVTDPGSVAEDDLITHIYQPIK